VKSPLGSITLQIEEEEEDEEEGGGGGGGRVSKPKGTSLTFEARFCSTTATTKTTHE